MSRLVSRFLVPQVISSVLQNAFTCRTQGVTSGGRGEGGRAGDVSTQQPGRASARRQESAARRGIWAQCSGPAQVGARQVSAHLQDVPEDGLHEPVLQARAKHGHDVAVHEPRQHNGAQRQDGTQPRHGAHDLADGVGRQVPAGTAAESGGWVGGGQQCGRGGAGAVVESLCVVGVGRASGLEGGMQGNAR